MKSSTVECIFIARLIYVQFDALSDLYLSDKDTSLSKQIEC